MEHIDKKLQVAVKAFVVDDTGKILLLAKNPTHRPDYPSKWDIPGGRINIGSNLLENLDREMMEEVGMTVKGVPKLIFAQDIIRDTFHIVRLSYIVKASGDLKLSSEHLEYAWLSYDELVALDNVDECIREVIGGVPRETFLI